MITPSSQSFLRPGVRPLPLLSLLAIFGGLSARADFIQPDTAVASTAFSAGFDGAAVNTINGSGLPPSFTPASAHAAYASGNHWVTTGSAPTDQSIVWGFSTPQNLDAIYLWNHQSTTPTADNPGYDVTVFDLTLYNASSQVLLTLNNVALAPDTATGQLVSFGATVVGVSSVRFDVEATQSSPNYTGLAEVGFNRVAAVPEPAAAALLAGLGAVALAGLRRHRRQG